MPEVGESGAMPRPHVREVAVRSDGAGLAVRDVHVAGASAPREGECMPPISSAINDKNCTHNATDGEDTTAMDDPGMESHYHALPATADSAAADDEAYV